MKTNDLIHSKIYYFSKEEDRANLMRLLAFWRFREKKIIFTNGCFDILHLGHIDYLSKSSDLGDILIIGLNTDSSVKKIKDKGRPVNDENARANILASIGFVNAVVLFDETTPYDLIKIICPNILIKGSDYKLKNIVGYDIVRENGGEIVTIDFLEGYSTSSIIKKIKLL